MHLPITSPGDRKIKVAEGLCAGTAATRRLGGVATVVATAVDEARTRYRGESDKLDGYRF